MFVRSKPPAAPLIPPAMPLACTFSCVVTLSRPQTSNTIPLDAAQKIKCQKVSLGRWKLGNLPQNVVPKVNHWIPDARAKSVGVVERRTPANAPIVIPEIPADNIVISLQNLANNEI